MDDLTKVHYRDLALWEWVTLLDGARSALVEYAKGICALESPKLQVQVLDRGPGVGQEPQDEGPRSEVGDIGVGAIPRCITAATRSYN